MAKLHRMERTWLSSVVFMDIVGYSSRSVDEQMRWKLQFNDCLTAAIKDVPPEERVMLDTGDGAAICFLGAPEAAMFAALDVWHTLISGERDQPGGPSVRIGINLGPIRLVKDINGAWNAIGDGINDGQRIMSFAAGNEILVSQSFYDVISRISDDYKEFFHWKGVARDRHVREHRVFTLFPPESQKWPASDPQGSDGQASAPASSAYKRTAVMGTPSKRRNRRAIALAGVAAVLAIAGGTWYFFRPAPTSVAEAILAAPSNGTRANLPALNPPTAAAAPQPDAAEGDGSSPPDKSTPGKVRRHSAGKSPDAPASAPEDAARANKPPISMAAKEAYGRASQLLHDLKFTEALPYYDAAIKANPEYVNAYVGRADALRRLGKYEQSVADCNTVMQINSSDPRGHNCRGVAYVHMSRFAEAIQDFDEAIRLNPSFGVAYIGRGDAFSGLRQYHQAVEDFSEAIQRRPKDGEVFLRRAGAYSSLGAYKKAIQDYDETINLMPRNMRAFNGRAAAEEALGNKAAADADRRHAAELAK
jgi:tetratricopeptide (TPR) repeat protein